MEVWQQSVPEGMSTRLDQLKVSVVNREQNSGTLMCYVLLQDVLSVSEGPALRVCVIKDDAEHQIY